MARTAKAPATTPEPKISTDSPPPNILRLTKSVVLVTLLAIVSLASRLALHPLFGNAPTSLYHPRILLIACAVSMLLLRLPEHAALLAVASLLAYAPHATYLLAVWSTQQWQHPARGAALVQGFVLVPVFSVSITLMKQWNNRLMRYVPGPLSLKAFFALSTLSWVGFLESWIQRNLPLGGVVNSSNMFIASAAAFTILAALSSTPPASPPTKSKGKDNARLPSPSRRYTHMLPFLLPALAAAFAFSQPPLASPTLPYTRQTPPAPINSSEDMPPATVRLLARAHGPTGLVVVGEHVEEEFRFLRVDHSILGGRWFGDKVAPDARNGLGDSIYTAFVLQEAVRLVQRKKKDKESALLIGLGVGVAAEALIAHGVETSVVEIDPVVYKYAREFFGLPEPAQVYLEDARRWLQQYQGEKFDYVIHDCFSGGGVPEHLFTVEFWDALQGIVTADGVVAVNFAGQIGGNAARAVYLTLQESFGTCRGFHDQISPKLDPEYSFFNIVFFCTPKGTPPAKFRTAKEQDYLVSHLRLHVLSELRERELNASVIMGNATSLEGLVLRDEANSLGEWQAASGGEHWEVMRQVLPDIFWETY